MTLAAGSRLGPYEILAPLATGGIAELYDTEVTESSPRPIRARLTPIAHLTLGRAGTTSVGDDFEIRYA